MRELNTNEVEMINGGWAKSISDAVEGALFGFGDAMATGMAVGTQIGGAAGGGVLGVGLIGSLVGVFVGGIVGAGYGVIGGFALGREDIEDNIADYRDKFGVRSKTI